MPAPAVEILGKRYDLIPVDPLPLDLLIRRMQIGQAAAQAITGSVIPYEVLTELGAACLGQVARRLSVTPWRVPVGQYGYAVIRELLADVPAAAQARALAEIRDASMQAWLHLDPLGVGRARTEQATEPEVAAAEGFFGPPPANTPR